MTRERARSVLRTVAMVGAGMVVLSILIANIVGELPEPMWVLLVPVGMLGGGVATLASATLLLLLRRAG